MIFNTGSGGNATRIVTGKSLHLADTAGGKYKNIKLVGASVQNGTPAVSEPVDIVSNKVKSITGCGKNFFDITTLKPKNSIQGGTVDFNGDIANVSSANQKWTVLVNDEVSTENGKTYTLQFKVSNFSATTEVVVAINNGEGKRYFDIYINANGYYEKTFVSTNNILGVEVVSNNSAEYVTNTFTISEAQLEEGTFASPYEPYTAITAELDQTYELNGFNGIYDEIDLERGVRIQRFGVQVFDGSDDEEWTIGTTNNGRRMQLHIPVKPASNTNVKGNVLCDSYIVTTTGENYMEKEGVAVDTSNRLYVYDARFKTSSLSNWKAHLQANPMTVVYELETPIETPLSVDELIAFNKLRAYKSGSTLFSGCDMEVEYFLNNKVGQPMADVHLNTAKYILDGATLNIIV